MLRLATQTRKKVRPKRPTSFIQIRASNKLSKGCQEFGLFDLYNKYEITRVVLVYQANQMSKIINSTTVVNYIVDFGIITTDPDFKIIV